LNRNRLDSDMILRTAPKEIQEERRRILSRRQIISDPSARVSGTHANLMTEGSGFLIGGGDSAKTAAALEEAVSTMVRLDGHYVANVFDLTARHKALIDGRNKHMQKQGELTSDRLRDAYSNSRKMNTGAIFGTGDGLLQTEARDEIRRREEQKKSMLSAAEQKKKKTAWDLYCAVEEVRDGIAAKHCAFFRGKGITSLENVKESDLDEGMIRKLNVESLKTLVKWKKIKGDQRMPTLKNELATRLIATMGRQSPPRPSPYNSDEEDDMDNEDGGEDEAAVDPHVEEEEEDEEDDDEEEDDDDEEEDDDDNEVQDI
jgi:hypothetical protein